MSETGERGLWRRVAGRTRELFNAGLRSLATPLAPSFYEDLEELLIAGDLGPSLAARITEGVRQRRPLNMDEARAALIEEVLALMSTAPRLLDLSASPACILLYGINGAGKTTTAGKLAFRLRNQGRRPLVVAADTYRAAGIEQVVAWAERAGVPSFAGQAGGDPAAVVFDGLQLARSRGHGVVVVDTAGRLQTQRNLVAELAKIGRVAGRALPGAPHESLLVLDAVLGQASIIQAREFHNALPISGLVVAKLDASAKGGAVVAIESQLGVPTKLAGVGEKMEDLVDFDPAAFASSLFG